MMISPRTMHNRIAIIENEGGSDKRYDGHRKDTPPLLDAIRSHGRQADVYYYRDTRADDLKTYLIDTVDGYISRINPGNLPHGEERYLLFLRQLADAGIVAIPHPTTMRTLGAKDVLLQLRDTPFVPDDTYCYTTPDQLSTMLPRTLASGTRVLKHNRGSTGNGIRRVEVAATAKKHHDDDSPLSPATPLRCTEAVDNHIEEQTIDTFVQQCSSYLTAQHDARIIDVPYLPRIIEGELRVLLIDQTPIFVVHKQPKQTTDAFSATLFSGATYTYHTPDKRPDLIETFVREIPHMMNILNVETPLLWTADFILDTPPDSNTGSASSRRDRYILSEINCSCVGFSSQLDQGIQDMIARSAIDRITTQQSHLGQ